MGKDIHSRLQWLEEELLEEQELPSGADDLDFELDDILAEFGETPEEPKLYRNRAREFDRMAFGDEVLPDSAAVLVEKKKKAPKAQKGAKGVGGLAVVAVLEVIAIILVLLRWALWFL